MIIIGNISEIEPEVEIFDGTLVKLDEIYGIVRNTKNKTWLKNIPDLSPSNELYNYYLKEKKNFTWTLDKFKNIYLPWYMKDILNTKITFDKNKNIFLGCFCQNETLCHRSILGVYLELLGYSVVSTSNDMKRFLEYKELVKKFLEQEKAAS